MPSARTIGSMTFPATRAEAVAAGVGYYALANTRKHTRDNDEFMRSSIIEAS